MSPDPSQSPESVPQLSPKDNDVSPAAPSPMDKSPQKPRAPRLSKSTSTSKADITQTLQKSWQTIQPILNTQTLNALRALSQASSWGIDRLQRSSSHRPTTTANAQAPSSQLRRPQPTQSRQPSWVKKGQAGWDVARPVLSAQTLRILRVLNDAIAWSIQRLDAPLDPNQAIAQPTSSSSQTARVLDRFAANFQQGWAWWSAKLKILRDRLPASWRSLLPPPVMTSLLVIGFMLLLSSISSSSPAQTYPPPSRSIAEPIAALPQPESLSSSDRASVPATDVAQPSVPDMPLERTPEQSLIAAIQDQVADITHQYADGLIQSIQANFRRSRLTVNLGEAWYALSTFEQDQLAREILARSTELMFNDLELLDTQGDLVGRSPVVGSTLIILKRTSTPDVAK